jgi:choline dehydrogenase-like flavoprotein
MFIDARKVPQGTVIETDVCIVGAGAAGITLAREFIGAHFQVCLLESGGLEFDKDTQSLYQGINVGFPYYNLDALRLRYFGGTTNHWAGACRPLDASDFESRPWVPYSGWPFDKAHMDPFYMRAHPICQIGPYEYDLKAWETKDCPRLPILDKRVATTIHQGSPPTRFGQVYREEIKRAPNIRTYLFANVVRIEVNSTAQQVVRLRVATLQGNTFWCKARRFILATGAIENVRLLLSSNEVQRAGLGNQNDLVGRFFMEHLCVSGGIFLPSIPDLPMGLYKDLPVSRGRMQGIRRKGYLTLSPETLRREELLNVRAFVDPPAGALNLLMATSEGESAAQVISGAIRAGNLPDNFVEHLLRVITDIEITAIDDIAIYSYRKFFQSASNMEVYWLYHYMEQVPNPDSRVTLISERDTLGMQWVQLDWRLGDLEKRTLRRSNEIFAQALGHAGLGRVKIVHDDPDTGWPSVFRGPRGGWHQIGTTRMHPDPNYGVVDKNCRVHGISNLFVAGSSVFPTCGYMNPTLTIIALSLRLADHVKWLMRNELMS